MRKRLIVATVVLSLAGCIRAEAADLTIGLLFPTDPVLKNLGNNMRGGVELGVEEIQKSGLLQDKLNVVFQSYADPADALTKAAGLVEREKAVVVIGPATASAALAVEDKLKASKIPHFLIATQMPASRSGPYTFQFNPNQEQTLQKVIDHISANYKDRKSALICQSPAILSCSQIETALKDKLGSQFEGSKNLSPSSPQKEIMIFAPNAQETLSSPSQGNVGIAIVPPQTGPFMNNFWPLSVTYSEAAFSKSLRDELRKKNISGNPAEVMAAHQAFAVTQMIAQTWKANPGGEPDKFVEAFQKKGSFDTVLGTISVTPGKLYCPNCTEINCTYPKKKCDDDASQCCPRN